MPGQGRINPLDQRYFYIEKPKQNGCHFHERHFEFHLIVWKLLCFDVNFPEVCYYVSNWQQVSIGSDNGLVPIRRQAIEHTWTVHDLVCRCVYSFSKNNDIFPKKMLERTHATKSYVILTFWIQNLFYFVKIMDAQRRSKYWYILCGKIFCFQNLGQRCLAKSMCQSITHTDTFYRFWKTDFHQNIISVCSLFLKQFTCGRNKKFYYFRRLRVKLLLHGSNQTAAAISWLKLKSVTLPLILLSVASYLPQFSHSDSLKYIRQSSITIGDKRYKHDTELKQTRSNKIFYTDFNIQNYHGNSPI